jgi:transposase
MYYIGIDVSTKESALCILDGKGKIVRETKLPTDPEIIARFIAATGLTIERIGLESGCTAAWLFAGLQRHGWPVICIDARHAAAALQAGFRNKNDRNDARGIADLMRVNKYRPVWVKSPKAQQQGRLLTARATLQSQLVALENTIRGLLRQEGIGLTDRRTAFEAAVREAIGEDCLLQAALHPLLETRNAVLRHRAALDREILRIVRADPVCRLLMTAPGVGALVSLAFKVAVDDPRRFSRSRDVGAHFGLTPREYSSGEVSYHGRISKMGDREVRRLLYVAASRILRRDAALWCPLKVWAVRLAQRVGIRRARVALARKLAVVLHAMWSDGQVFQWRRSEASASA